MEKQVERNHRGRIAVEYDGAGNEVYIHADLDGLKRLNFAINRLVDAAGAGNYDHDHLMGPAWGGRELSGTPPQSNTQDQMVTVDHVKILAWPLGFADSDS